MFFSRAFMSASSALIVSTYFELSIFELATRGAALADADDAGGGAALS